MIRVWNWEIAYHQLINSVLFPICTTIGFKNIEPSLWRHITRTPRDLYSWFIYPKIGNLFGIELSSAHNFHLHDENSENKKRNKTTHFFECSRKVLFTNLFWLFCSSKNYQKIISAASVIPLSCGSFRNAIF